MISPFHWIRSFELEFVLRHTQLSPGSLILDVGCGPGTAGSILEKAGHRAIYLDLQKYPGLGHGCLSRFVRASAESMPFDSNSFDLVLAVSSVEHISDDESFFTEARRILKPGGRLILTTDSDSPNVSPAWKTLEWPLRVLSGGWKEEPIRDLSEWRRTVHARNHRVIRFYRKDSLDRTLRDQELIPLHSEYLLTAGLSKLLFEACTFITFLRPSRRNPVFLLLSPLFLFLSRLTRRPKDTDGYILALVAEKPVGPSVAQEMNRARTTIQVQGGNSSASSDLKTEGVTAAIFSVILAINLFLNLNLELVNLMLMALVVAVLGLPRAYRSVLGVRPKPN